VHLQAHRRVDRVDVQQVGLGADEAVERHHDGLADRVDRRVRDLGEQLLEVVVERLVLVGQHGQRAVVAHRADAFFAVDGHGRQQELDVFLRVAEGLLAVQQRLLEGRRAGVGRHVVQRRGRSRSTGGRAWRWRLVLQLLVVDDAALLQVDQEHLARLQAPLLDDLVLGDGQHAGFGGHDHQVVVGDQ
jgi:hypothetical protein